MGLGGQDLEEVCQALCVISPMLIAKPLVL
jgi:hypothetical protein